MNEKQLNIILGYDVESLKKNIKRREDEINTLESLIKKGAKNPEAFLKEIEKAKKDMENLTSYIKLIEEEQHGSIV